MNLFPRITSRDPTPLRYQTDPLEHRDPSPWRDTYVLPPPMRLRQPWDNLTPYQWWSYGHATEEDNNLRLRDPDTFWPDMLIGDQYLTPDKHRLCREQMGIPPIPPHCRATAEQVPAFDERGVEIPYVPNLPPQPQEGPSGLQPRHSSREKRPVVYPDNVYESPHNLSR
jgi:hypothetical protein